MSRFGVPFVLTNLGAEMIYILDRRLKDQKIPKDKSNKVLLEIAKVIFGSSLWQQIKQPQSLYSVEAMKVVFKRIAHSSQIKLNAPSMAKMYDLMQMVFKYQILSCPAPTDLWSLTMQHILSVQALIPSIKDEVDFQEALHALQSLSKRMSCGDWLRLRQTLLAFLKDKKVRISLLVEDALQSGDDGSLLGPLVSGIDACGHVDVRRADPAGGMRNVDSFKIKLAGYAAGAFPQSTCLNVPLGENLYEASQIRSPRAGPSGKGAPGAPGASAASPSVDSIPTKKLEEVLGKGEGGGPGSPAKAKEYAASSKVDAGLELDSLAMLIGAPRPVDDNFKLNILSLTTSDMRSTHDGEEEDGARVLGASAGNDNTLVIDANMTSGNATLLKLVDGFDALAGADDAGLDAADEEDDLLALMDSAVS